MQEDEMKGIMQTGVAFPGRPIIRQVSATSHNIGNMEPICTKNAKTNGKLGSGVGFYVRSGTVLVCSP
jgi:hypothetical protein